jgi:hypothetical protein
MVAHWMVFHPAAVELAYQEAAEHVHCLQATTC